MEITAWSKDDISEIVCLERVCFSDPWSEEAFFSSLEAPYLYGYAVRENGEILGYALLSVLFEEAELLNIAVAPEARGKGTGSELLKRLLFDAKTLGAEKVFLEVRVSNLAALALYRKFGFKDGYVRKKYYEDGEDALVMMAEL